MATVGELLREIASDAVGEFLRPNPRMPGGMGWGSDRVYGHRLHAEFEAAVSADPDLRQLFPTGEAEGPTGVISKSTGSVLTLQRSTLAFALMIGAASRLLAEGRLTAERLPLEVETELDTVRAAVRGEDISVLALMAFTNVTLDESVEISTPWGVVRAIQPHESAFAPEALSGTLQHLGQHGSLLTVRVSGDMLLAAEFPYMLQIEPWEPESPVHDRRAEFALCQQSAVTKQQMVCTAITLGTRGRLAGPIATWQLVLDPLSLGPYPSWREVRLRGDPMPVRLSAQDAREIEAVAHSLDRWHDVKVDVALTRLQMAITGRIDPADRLIDAVIAWENLFGSREGELRMRISSALAWLLYPNDSSERARQQGEAKKLYDARSDVVHANVAKLRKHNLYELSNSAIDLTVRALRTLYLERPELVADDDRGLKLILGE